jgi:hypothetical protein
VNAVPLFKDGVSRSTRPRRLGESPDKDEEEDEIAMKTSKNQDAFEARREERAAETLAQPEERA